MNQPFIPLVAAGLDWLEGLLPVLFVVIWIASQVMNLFRGANKPEARPVPPQPRPLPRGGDANDVQREVEEFLRRSLAGRERPRTEPAAAPPARPPRRRQRRTPAAEPPPLPAGARPQTLGNSSVGTDVASHVATVFAHDLAHQASASTTIAPPAPVASPATDLGAALRAPGGLRQILLMQEVLTRPTHRW